MQLTSIRNSNKKIKSKENKKHFWLQKIEDYNLTKQKYFERKLYILHIA